MRYILLLILLTLSGCSAIMCDWMELCVRDTPEEILAAKNRAANNRVGDDLLFWPMLDMWIITEPQRN